MNESGKSNELAARDKTSKGGHLSVAGIHIPIPRTFRAIDRIFALPMERVGDIVEEKLRNNVKSHVDEVLSKRSKDGETTKLEERDMTVATATSLAFWAEGSSKVDSEEWELSAIWRAILDRIIQKDSEAEDLLKAVNGISRRDLRLFAASCLNNERRTFFARPFLGSERTAYQQLRSHGIIARQFDTSTLVLVAMCMAIAAYAALRLTEPFRSYGLGQELALMVGVVVGAALTFLVHVHRLTPLGKKLRKYYLIYRQRLEVTTPHASPTPDASPR